MNNRFASSTREFVAAACALTILVAGCAHAQTDAAPGAVTVPAGDKSITYFGRWDRSDPSVAHSHWGGAYLRTRFTGTSVGLKMQDNEDLVVSIDGEPFRRVAGKGGVTPLNPLPLPAGLHTLLVGPSTGGEAKVTGLVFDPGATVKPPIARPIIEFIGDSITWGTGPDGMWNVNHTWQAAEALDCDHTQVAQSARALTTGYGCADEKTGMDKQYFMLKNFGYVHDNPQVPWDFSAYTPSVIVINLGQNDACGNESDDTFTASYIQFVKNIRAKFPKAQIAALRMYGGGHFGEDTRKAVVALNAMGDARVHFIDTEGWLEKTDFADGVHPNAVGNMKAAMRLAPLLRTLLPPNPALSAATVGNPANPRGLARAIQNAYLRGERHIIITPGTYLLGYPGDQAFLLEHWHDAVISAYKVTLILDNSYNVGKDFNGRIFQINDCDNLTIAGPLVSQTAQTAYQGRVTAIGKDDQGNPTCDWKPSVGYPVPPDDLKQLWINVVDDKTKTLNLRAGDYYHAGMTPLGNGTYRFHLDNRPVDFAVGDWIVARYGDPPNKFFLGGCRNCTVKDVTMVRNGFAPIFDGGGAGNHILHCHWTLGPRPNGATDDPIVTNAADGLHSPGDAIGPDIEDCVFDGVFLDDCIAIHGGFHQIKSVSGPIVVASNTYSDYHVGEPVRISNDHGFYLQAMVTALKDNGDGTSALTLDTTETVPTDAYLSTPLHDGQGYKIINCKLGNTRSRGIIVKSDNGLIENTVVTHCGLGIRIGPEWNQEADYSQNVMVQGNTLSQNGDGIVVDGSGVKQNKNITITDNVFTANTGSALDVAWADGVTITGNQFSAPKVWPDASKPRPAISVRDTSNVTLANNPVKTPTAYPKPAVNIGSNVAQITQDASASAK